MPTAAPVASVRISGDGALVPCERAATAKHRDGRGNLHDREPAGRTGPGSRPPSSQPAYAPAIAAAPNTRPVRHGVVPPSNMGIRPAIEGWRWR